MRRARTAMIKLAMIGLAAIGSATMGLGMATGCGGDDEVLPPTIDAARAVDAAARIDAAPVADAAAIDGQVIDAGAVDASATDAGPSAGVGQVCGTRPADLDAGALPCASGLVCCYPCGIPDCVYRCAVPCDGGACSGGCLLVP